MRYLLIGLSLVALGASPASANCLVYGGAVSCSNGTTGFTTGSDVWLKDRRGNRSLIQNLDEPEAPRVVRRNRSIPVVPEDGSPVELD